MFQLQLDDLRQRSLLAMLSHEDGEVFPGDMDLKSPQKLSFLVLSCEILRILGNMWLNLALVVLLKQIGSLSGFGIVTGELTAICEVLM